MGGVLCDETLERGVSLVLGALWPWVNTSDAMAAARGVGTHLEALRVTGDGGICYQLELHTLTKHFIP